MLGNKKTCINILVHCNGVHNWLHDARANDNKLPILLNLISFAQF